MSDLVLTPPERAAMGRALELAAHPSAPLVGPNPRVGAVILAPHGVTLGEGFHRGAGTPHAEVMALTDARDRARDHDASDTNPLGGATAVLTLEPCRHTGRTGPCTTALLEAGIARVIIAALDPSPQAGGGAGLLTERGIDVVTLELDDPDAVAARAISPAWRFAARRGRPLVTYKAAASLDGRVSAADGTSRWITGPAAREQVHQLRAQVDAVLVGTGTALGDDPQLTVRDSSGALAQRQPLRVVVGHRPLPTGARLLDDSAPTLQLGSNDPAEVLAELYALGVMHVLLEGGPQLAAAFLAAGMVDRVVWFSAPILLGAGAAALAPFGVKTIGGATRLRVTAVTRVGDDVRIDATLRDFDE